MDPYEVTRYLVRQGGETLHLVACLHGDKIVLETAETEHCLVEETFRSLDDVDAYLRGEGWQIQRSHSGTENA